MGGWEGGGRGGFAWVGGREEVGEGLRGWVGGMGG